MTAYTGPGRSGAGTAVVRNIWPSLRDNATPIPSQYAGYYADRQTRFHVRSLRRDGVYFVDFPPVLLWFENGWAPENAFCP